MPTVKMTFTMDDETVSRLRLVAKRLGKPQSEVVREAIAEYSSRVGRLGEDEIRRLLAVFDEVVPKIPARAVAEVDREIALIRSSRRKSAEKRARRSRGGR